MVGWPEAGSLQAERSAPGDHAVPCSGGTGLREVMGLSEVWCREGERGRDRKKTGR